MSDTVWKVTYTDNSHGNQVEKVKEFEEPVLVEDVISWRKDNGHVIKTVEKTVDRVTWQDITKQSSWR